VIHAPFLADALHDPHVRCDICGGTSFHAPNLAMQWADPYTTHFAATCDECRAVNHLHMQWSLGRITLTHRSTKHDVR
jgi:hypothetical protein